MKNRIKAVRESVGMTQPDFGERLGMSRNVVNDLEHGRKAVPEFLILKICAEFNVNENWLRTGEGEMFVPFPINDLESIAEANNLSADYATAIRCLLKLPPVKQDIIVQYIKDVARELEEKQIKVKAKGTVLSCGDGAFYARKVVKLMADILRMAVKIIMCHLVGDYVFQSNYIATTKGENWYHMFVHCVLYCVPFAIVFGIDWRLAIIFGSHCIIDPLKARYNKITYTQDQIWHYAIAGLVYLL